MCRNTYTPVYKCAYTRADALASSLSVKRKEAKREPGTTTHLSRQAAESLGGVKVPDQFETETDR